MSYEEAREDRKKEDALKLGRKLDLPGLWGRLPTLSCGPCPAALGEEDESVDKVPEGIWMGEGGMAVGEGGRKTGMVW